MSSRLQQFYTKTISERARIVAKRSNLAPHERKHLETCLNLDTADRLIENVIGRYALPLGIATNFVINDRDVLIPMVIEEPSVVAACSFAAKLARSAGGFVVESDSPMMIGQIQVLDVPDMDAAVDSIEAHRDELLETANSLHRTIVELGGGAKDIELRRLLDTPSGPMLVVHLLIDTRDAMGANAINTTCEALAPRIETLTGGRVNLRILSNLADRRLARAAATWTRDTFEEAGADDPDAVIQGIIDAWAFAVADPYRATTHNKGIMNGIDAVTVATGNDWRAIEAGAHAYAARTGQYRSLTTFSRTPAGDLRGHIELPLAVGIVGGTTKAHPTAQVSLKILGVETAGELAGILAAVGLSQNFAALRALATEGIQHGHMTLHARQVAVSAGAEGADAERIAAQLVAEKNIRLERARELLRNGESEKS